MRRHREQQCTAEDRHASRGIDLLRSPCEMKAELFFLRCFKSSSEFCFRCFAAAGKQKAAFPKNLELFKGRVETDASEWPPGGARGPVV